MLSSRLLLWSPLNVRLVATWHVCFPVTPGRAFSHPIIDREGGADGDRLEGVHTERIPLPVSLQLDVLYKKPLERIDCIPSRVRDYSCRSGLLRKLNAEQCARMEIKSSNELLFKKNLLWGCF